MDKEVIDTLKIAEICYEANRVYCNIKETNSWEKASKELRTMFIETVEQLLKSPKTNKEIHEEWMKAQEDDGWVYGEKIDIAKKIHPLLLPYSDIPSKIRIRGVLFTKIIEAFTD